MRHSTSWERSALLVTCLLIGGPLNGYAQVVRGTVVDSAGRGIEGAVILINDNRPQSAVTDESGRFAITLMSAGRYRLSITTREVDSAWTQQLMIGPRDTLALQIQIGLDPVRLPEIVVTATSRSPALELVGFYARELEGLGHFIHRSDIAARRPRLLTDLMHGVQGVRIVRRGQSTEMMMRAGLTMGVIQNKHCFPTVFIDGANVRPGGTGSAGVGAEIPVDELIDPESVEGVEVYRSPAQLPIQYSGADKACGVVLIWTRR